MKIENLINFLTSGIIVLVPNVLEKKILMHRLMCSGIKGFTFINDSIRHNDKEINILTIEEANKIKPTKSDCFVEFPEAIPDNTLTNLHKNFNNIIFTNEIM